MEKYTKVKVIGKGSYGYAVLVQSKKNKKPYIIKVPKSYQIIDTSRMNTKQRDQAYNQVEVLKLLKFPHIVTYRQYFIEKKCLCIVMDYCDAGDLFDKIAKQKEMGVLFSENQILVWFVHMALALKHVHDRKILHRDLKTQNIFLTSKGHAKIGDFGISRVLQHTYDCANTAIGTPYYLSPEICQEKPYNQKSDIWSLGCILYQLTTLNHAFDAQEMKGLVQKILKGTYPPIPPQYSNELRTLISDLLTKDPNKRPSTKKILQLPFIKNKVKQMIEQSCDYNTMQQTRPHILDLRNEQNNNILKNMENKKSISPHNIKMQRQMKKQQKSKSNLKPSFLQNQKPQIMHNRRRTPKRMNHQQSYEQQPYNALLNQVKRLNSNEQEKIQEDIPEKFRVVPNFLNINIGVSEKDTTGSKIQALRFYLQKMIGSNFIQVYRLVEKNEEDYKDAIKILGKQKSKYISLIVQLIVCQDSYY